MTTTLDGLGAKLERQASTTVPAIRRRAAQTVGVDAQQILTRSYAEQGFRSQEITGKKGRKVKWRVAFTIRNGAVFIRPRGPKGAVGGAYLAEFGTHRKPNGYRIVPGIVGARQRAAVRLLAGTVAGKKVRKANLNKERVAMRTPFGPRASVLRGPQRGRFPFKKGIPDVAKRTPVIYAETLREEFRKAGMGR